MTTVHDVPDPIRRVREVAAEFAASSMYVRIDDDALGRVADAMPAKDRFGAWPRLDMEPMDVAVYELAASAVNYCYWYGRSGYKPAGGSTRMYELLDEAYDSAPRWPARLRTFASLVSVHGFPLADRRAAHILELLEPLTVGTVEDVAGAVLDANSAAKAIRQVTLAYPGFASDLFLKRAFLYLMQLNRRLDWGGELEQGIGDVPVPVDYQIPKVLRHLGVMEYREGLAAQVDNEEKIGAGSRQELEIRACTLIACDRLAMRAGLRPAWVDEWLWLQRRDVPGPYHLTVTTDY